MQPNSIEAMEPDQIRGRLQDLARSSRELLDLSLKLHARIAEWHRRQKASTPAEE